MKSVTYPLAMPVDLREELKQATKESGLSTAATIRQSAKLGLPQVPRQRVKPEIRPKSGWHMGGVGAFGLLLAEVDLIHYDMGASERDEEAAIRKAVDFSTTTRRQTVGWSGLPCEARFWDWKLEPAKAHYL